MQRHTQLYSRLIEFCELNPISAINLAFVIPSIPEGTFRNDKDLGSSSLFDIGCYIVALINDLGLDIGALDVVGATDPGTASEAVDIAGQCDGIAVTARVGVGSDYRNRADVRLSNGSTVGFQPIFYGRPGAKVIGNETICDENAFETMFAVPREHWLVDQQARLAAIVSVTERLEELAQQLARFRAEAT